MKKFSDFLLDYIKDGNMTWQTAAKLCDVDRTSLSRYAHGKKLPESMDKVLKIANGLGMTRQQTEEFGTLYEVCRKGTYEYMARELVDDIFCGQEIWEEKLSPDRSCLPDHWQGNALKRLRGQEEICDAFSCVVHHAARIGIHMDFTEKSRVLLPVLSGADMDCRIEHIIEINNMSSHEAETEELRSLFPILASERNYRIYCHYRWCKEEKKAEERMCMIFSDRGLLVFTPDMTDGMFTDAAGCREYYEQMFDINLKKCRIFGGSGNGTYEAPGEEGEEYCLKNADSRVAFVYQNVPRECVWVHKKDETPISFYLEEAGLVKQFREYMKI